MTETTTTETTTDTITYTMTAENAKRMAAISHAAATGRHARPTLAIVGLEYDPAELRVTATDSFLLARRTFQVGSDSDTYPAAWEIGHTGSAVGRISLEATAWRDALAAASKIKNATGRPISLEISADMVAVVVAATGSRQEIRRSAYDLPSSLESIVTDNRVDGRPEDPNTDETYTGSLPAFDPGKLARLAKTTGYTPSQLLALVPRTTIAHTAAIGRKDPALLPMVYNVVGKGIDGDWFGILMPYRIPHSGRG